MKLNGIFLLPLSVFLLVYHLTCAQTGQRSYKAHSVLATGSWHKLAVSAAGIYKIDVPLLQQLGINTREVPAAHIRLFGSGGRMLPEANRSDRYDDLPETALYIADGGDGYLDGNDYLLFYAPGVDHWDFDNSFKTFHHQKHLYSDTAWYFLNTDAPGLRIKQDTARIVPGTPVHTFDYLTFYERDSLNFLNSGKQWWGPEFGKVAGLQQSYAFTLPAPPAGPVTVQFRAAARGGSGSNFNISVNGTAAGGIYLLPVTGNIFEGVATAATGAGSVAVAGQALQVTAAFEPGDVNARGWLDYLEIQARCRLTLPAAGMLLFRDSHYTTGALPATYTLHNVQAHTQVWEVTDPLHPVAVHFKQQGDSLVFNGKQDQLREYVAFNSSAAQLPVVAGPVANQDLHGTGPADMLIVTTTALQGQAERLAAWHRSREQLTVLVTTVDKIYQEFAAGAPDPAAIRDYVKMFYDRGPAPRYLLLLGAASYDYRQRTRQHSNMVPSWQSEASLDAIRSYVSDDFFGLLDDQDDITRVDIPNLLDIGMGRIPARDVAEAALAVDKIIRYGQPATLGPWRNQVTLVADDEDDNIHFDAAEAMSRIITKSRYPADIDKIYLDAYPQTATNAGSRAPEVNKAIDTRINKGSLIFNYTGHGSNARLAEETVLDAGNLPYWQNENKLPLFITATCDFEPFDDPGITSIGHKVLLQHRGGAIALMTTTRAVFSYANQVMNSNYMKAAFTPQADGTLPALGTAAMLAKNMTYSSSGDIINNRKFQLLGDPALTLAFPAYRVITDSINGKAIAVSPDTLQGLMHYTLKGHLADVQGNPLPRYEGTLYTTIFDKPATLHTRGNDPRSKAAAYTLQQQVLFRGTQTITGGQFTLDFIAPADLAAGSGKGKISYYASDGQRDGNGFFDHFTTGGMAGYPPADITGPGISVWLDKYSFQNGDIVGNDPLLIVELADSSGLNISGNNREHLMVAILDGTEYFVLNDYFEASLNSYRRGVVRFPLQGIAAGTHSITIKAWDTYNNAATVTVYFKVATPGELAVEEVGNYPNPFHDGTRFTFLHNQQEASLQLTLQIFTLEGRQVKIIRHTIISASGRFDGMPWDGRGDSGAKMSPGLYIYRLTITNISSGKTRVKGGKLVLF
ncbi:type IX secretion system sortase PorU [Chitinophaga nivalis]|uniref:Type IX secretion system sortase PorU n=1 Tax=Chitinophaga nivalis TaxID=2991709 RepID=A0ABT3IWJ8_9BACT|nr:type IX secretion system sortase PorU [Chitinophaga nivalis]MCW3461969.1 type IX secretion system sortase PorU [Chitinophaga nivalis]MCW3488340.1 type IX secretion system sortase PorU [Chitinophaga nivalis]